MTCLARQANQYPFWGSSLTTCSLGLAKSVLVSLRLPAGPWPNGPSARLRCFTPMQWLICSVCLSEQAVAMAH